MEMNSFPIVAAVISILANAKKAWEFGLYCASQLKKLFDAWFSHNYAFSL